MSLPEVPAALALEQVAPPVDRPVRPGRDLTGPVVLVVALGLLLHAYVGVLGRRGTAELRVDLLFWVSLGVMFVPVAARVVAGSTPARERFVLTLVLPLALMASRLLLYPVRFVRHDELAHENTLRVLQETSHLFGANPLLPASSAYPGLEVATAGVRALTGLGDFGSSVVVLVLARVVLTLAVLLLVQRVTGSMRVACLASLLYTCNPQYLFFNSQYSYQTLALPLALVVVALVVLQRRGVPGGGVSGRRAELQGALAPAACLAAVVVVHHLTSMLLVVALLVAWVVERVLWGRSRDSRLLGGLTLLGIVLVAGWALRPGNTVGSYLSSIADSSAEGIDGLVRGKQQRALFSDGSGEKTPVWQQAALVASLGLLTVALLPALWHARRWWRQGATVAVVLSAVGLLFPIIPAGHLTAATSEVTDRSSGFVFVGVAFVLAVWLGRRRAPPVRAGARRRRVPPALVTTGLTVLISVVFVGQTVFGSGPVWSRAPGPFLVSADSRSVDAANLAAADWEARSLPPGSRVLADRVGRLLAAADGGQYAVTHLADGIDASQVLLGALYTPRDTALIRQARIAFVVVDERDATGLPRIGVYYENGELGGDDRRTPVPLSALRKLAAVPGVQRLYDNGHVVVYDVRALRDG